jgi:hypothetical protein
MSNFSEKIYADVYNLIEYFNDYFMISGSSMDDMKMIENYQFFDKKIHTNSIVGIGLKLDLQCDTYTTHGMKKTQVNFKVTKTSKDRRLIKKINNKPATNELINLLKWPEEYLDESIYRRVFYYPIGFEDNGTIVPEIIGSFVGDSILVSWKIKKPELNLLTISGEGLIKSVDENLKMFEGKTHVLGLMCACGARLETLGSNVYIVKESLSRFFGSVPFLLLYVGGESTYSKKRGLIYGNDTINTAIFFKEFGFKMLS